MRIAICLSGYFRLYREIYQNFYDCMYNPCQQHGEVDLFISSWDELNSASSFSARQGDTSPSLGLFDQQDILKTFPAKESLFESFDDVKEQFQLHRYDSSVDLSTLYPTIHDNGILFGLAMFYKRLTCNEMKSRHEEATGQRYDMVIQLRPDAFFFQRFDPTIIDTSKLYAHGDHLLVSSSDTMDKVSSVYSEANRIINHYKADRPCGFEPYCPEYFLEHRLSELGFNESNRVALGEDFMHVYPRKNFVAGVVHVLSKYNRMSELHTVLNYPLSRR